MGLQLEPDTDWSMALDGIDVVVHGAARRSTFVSSIGLNDSETVVSPFAAKDTPAPHSPYAQSKLEAGPALCKSGGEWGMEIVIIRPQLTDGPGASGSSEGVLRDVRRGMPLPRCGVDTQGSHFALDDKLVGSVATVPGTHSWRVRP